MALMGSMRLPSVKLAIVHNARPRSDPLALQGWSALRNHLRLREGSVVRLHLISSEQPQLQFSVIPPEQPCQRSCQPADVPDKPCDTLSAKLLPAVVLNCAPKPPVDIFLGSLRSYCILNRQTLMALMGVKTLPAGQYQLTAVYRRHEAASVYRCGSSTWMPLAEGEQSAVNPVDASHLRYRPACLPVMHVL